MTTAGDIARFVQRTKDRKAARLLEKIATVIASAGVVDEPADQTLETVRALLTQFYKHRTPTPKEN